MKIGQLIYTSSMYSLNSPEHGLNNTRGWHVLSCTPELTAAEVEDVRNLCNKYPRISDDIVLTGGLRDYFNPDVPSKFPITFSYFKLSNGKHCMIQTVYSGCDYDGRDGNTLDHALILHEFEKPFCAMDYMNSIDFRRCLPLSLLNNKQPDFLEPLTTLHEGKTEVNRTYARIAIDSLVHHHATGDMLVFFGEYKQLSSLFELMSQLPPILKDNLTYCTYSSNIFFRKDNGKPYFDLIGLSPTLGRIRPAQLENQKNTAFVELNAPHNNFAPISELISKANNANMCTCITDFMTNMRIAPNRPDCFDFKELSCIALLVANLEPDVLYHRLSPYCDGNIIACMGRLNDKLKTVPIAQLVSSKLDDLLNFIAKHPDTDVIDKLSIYSKSLSENKINKYIVNEIFGLLKKRQIDFQNESANVGIERDKLRLIEQLMESPFMEEAETINILKDNTLKTYAQNMSTIDGNKDMVPVYKCIVALYEIANTKNDNDTIDNFLTKFAGIKAEQTAYMLIILHALIATDHPILSDMPDILNHLPAKFWTAYQDRMAKTTTGYCEIPILANYMALLKLKFGDMQFPVIDQMSPADKKALHKHIKRKFGFEIYKQKSIFNLFEKAEKSEQPEKPEKQKKSKKTKETGNR